MQALEDKQQEFSLLQIPDNLNEEHARLYYPILCIGAPSPEEGSRAIEEVISRYPALAQYHQQYQRERHPFWESLLLHAHLIHVLSFDEKLLSFQPRLPVVRYADKSLVIGESLSVEMEPESPGELQEYAGLLVVMCLSLDTPLLPQSTEVARRIKQTLNQFFLEGLPTAVPGKRIWPGEKLSWAYVSRAFRRLTGGSEATHRAPAGGVLELPRAGSATILVSDGTPAGYVRVAEQAEELRSLPQPTRLRRDEMTTKDLAEALQELRVTLEREQIPFALIGALAMREHGYARFTEDIDIVTTPDGLEKIHQRLIGRGWLPKFPGARKKLRDTSRQIQIDIIQSGEHAGSDKSPVVYPDPSAKEFSHRVEQINYATLEALITFKLAAGIWGKDLKHLADVQELIKVNQLEESFAANLPEEVREKFIELIPEERDPDSF